MPRRYFGTDGVRGVVGEDLTPALVERLGRAFGAWMGSAGGRSVLVGRDTRASGPELERALAAGLCAAGRDVVLGGVLPTPAVALLAEDHAAVVSASHNPPEYNGLKLLAPGGRKLSDAEEAAIEARLDGRGTAEEGTVRAANGLHQRYLELVVRRFGRDLRGLRVALDCANGAMSSIAPAAFERVGARVTPLAAEPDGTNINVGCGATDLSLLAAAVREGSFDIGIAFDGDGDRMLAVDASGTPVDGDQILAILALHTGVAVVAVTTLTNLGFHELMGRHGIRVVTTDVGDRYVLEALTREGGVLGGEQSGHIIDLRGQVTGDGLAAALLLCAALEGRSLAEAAAVMPRYPQVKENVPATRKELSAALLREVERINEELGETGRAVVRPSGTEPVVRVLAEARTRENASEICARIAALVRRELG
ncbi:MAG: phosphoglucosamine mutase [Actinomycetota bacterium]|nr:phosphoglucosamine mutase [Actinomycetota bacterium]